MPVGNIVHARKLSRATMAKIWQNLFFSILFNAAGGPIAIGVLYLWFGLLLSPIIAGSAMAFSSVAVVGNSPRLRSGAGPCVRPYGRHRHPSIRRARRSPVRYWKLSHVLAPTASRPPFR